MAYAKKYLSRICLLISFICISCLLTDTISYPYIIDSVQCLIQEDSENYKTVAVEFDFYNTAEKEIQNIEIQFYVYDSETKQNPLKENNLVRLKYPVEIEAQSFKGIQVYLNSLITEFPSKAYIVDHLVVLKIEYSDSSVWKNPGIFLQVIL